MATGPSGTGFDIPIALNEQRQSQDISDRAALHMLQRKQLADMYGNMAATPLPDRITDPNDPGYADSQKAYQAVLDTRAKGLAGSQKVYSPEHHASFMQHIHGLIHGAPVVDSATGQIAPNGQAAPTNLTSANAPTTPNGVAAVGSIAPPGSASIPIVAGAQPAPTPDQTVPADSIHPLGAAPDNHPASKIAKGIQELRNHLKGLIHPLPPAPPPDWAAMAAAPTEEERKNAETEKVWGIKGKNAMDLQGLKNTALLAALNARKPQYLSQMTIPALMKEVAIDPTITLVGPEGRPISPAQLSEMPPNWVAREFKAGFQTFISIGEQNSKTLNVAGHIYDIPAIGEIALEGPNQNSTVLGQATSTLPTQSTETSPGGNQVLKGTSEKIVPPVATSAPTAPAPTSIPAASPTQPASPVLKVRAQANPSSPTPVAPLTPNGKKMSVGTGSLGDIAPNIQNMTQANAAKAMKSQPAVTALLGLYGDPQLPQVKSMMDFSKLAGDPHAQKVLGEAFKLLNQQMGEISDPGVISTLGTAMGWANFRANAEAQAQQQAGTAMTDAEKEYFNAAIASMADIIGARAATGQSPARFSVQFMENEIPQIGTSSVTDEKSYLQKMLTIARQVKVGLNAMPDNSRANKWLLQRENELIQKSNQLSSKLNPKSANAPSTPTGRPAGVPADYVLRDGPKGRGYYAPTAK